RTSMEAEEESATESFSENKRTVFIERRLKLLHTLKTDKWSKYIQNENNQKILQDFLEKDGPPFLFFNSTPEGGLTAVHEVPTAIKSKTVYVMKKANTPIGKDTIGKELIFGEISGGPIEHITTFLE
ncbi:hypothetical protein NDU88_005600, partial [Pleurodeles waltl]